MANLIALTYRIVAFQLRVYFGKAQSTFDIAMAQLFGKGAQLTALGRIQRGGLVRQRLALLLSCLLGTKFLGDVHAILPNLAVVPATEITIRLCQRSGFNLLGRLRIGQGRRQHRLHRHGQQVGNAECFGQREAGGVSLSLLDGAIRHLQVLYQLALGEGVAAVPQQLAELLAHR